VGHGPTISVIDDDGEVRASLQNFLRAAGMAVRSFPGAREFLDDTGPSDCVITDLHMPDMDGLALLDALAARGSAAPVIVMTAFPTEAARARSEAFGVVEFLTKPVDPDVLFEAIEAALHKA